MSMGFRADPTGNSGVITVAGADQVVVTNASNVVATTFTGALAGNADTATALSTASGAAPSYSARAFVVFDATRNESGAADLSFTPRFIYSSGNISSVTRQAVGSHIVNFATSFPNADYAFSFSAHHASGVQANIGTSAYSYATSSLGIFTFYGQTAGSYYDPTQVCVVIYR